MDSTRANRSARYPITTFISYFCPHSPQVAAGMSTVVDVEIFAVAVGVVGESGLGHVGHHVEIVTETDILYLPVTANILSY